MRQRHKLVGGLLIAALVSSVSSTARAEFVIATGLKWTPLRYTTPIRATTPPSEFTSVALSPNASNTGNGWQTTSLDAYLGLFPISQVGITLSLDLGYGSFHQDQMSTTMVKLVDDNWSFFQFGFALGGKFYLTKPTEKKISPYVFVDIYKYFAAINTNEIVPFNDQLAAIAGLHSPLGFDLAFGAEYFFTSSFSLGAEILGLRYSYVEGDFKDAALTTHRETDQTFTFYAGLSLNYRFAVGGKAGTETEEERKKPARRVRPQPQPRRPVEPTDQENPPPPPPGTPSPESVD